MEVGFDTIGNATLICYDRAPVLVTDPWVVGAAYFGSWGLSHEIPEEQMTAVKNCEYVWFSHGHPDHLNSESLPLLQSKKILLPNHSGKRIYDELKSNGYDVQILEDQKWYQLSERIKVLCIPDYNQDAILLIDVNGRLLVNLNDASNRGWGWFVKKLIKQYPISFLMALETFGDGDMINLYDENGNAIIPECAAKKPIGRQIAVRLENYGAKYFVPFSSLHIYQREDSNWASQYLTTLADYPIGFDSTHGELLPGFIRYDCLRDELTEINPRETEIALHAPEEFGDNWNDRLERDEAERVKKYFRAFEHLEDLLDFVSIRVGGEDHIVEFKKRKFNRGITFEVPRQSLMTSVNYEIFDDLLIGNFMKTIFHGDWEKFSLYPGFSPFIAKYGDNGRARSREELKQYFQGYKERAPLGYLQHKFACSLHSMFEEKAINVFRSFVSPDNQIYQSVKGVYRKLKKPKLV
jgi:hypothetical protein